MFIESCIYKIFLIFKCDMICYVTNTNSNPTNFLKGGISVLEDEYYVAVQKPIFIHV